MPMHALLRATAILATAAARYTYLLPVPPVVAVVAAFAPTRLAPKVPPWQWQRQRQLHSSAQDAAAAATVADAAADMPSSSSDGTAQQVHDVEAEVVRTLYPPINATRNGTLKVDSVHTLCYQLYGLDLQPNSAANDGCSDDDNSDGYSSNARIGEKNGKVAIFLHGGPGAGCYPNHARFFSPDHYSVILFDQRGCGRSAPCGEVVNNTLAHLVHDMEALRIHLNVDKFDVVLGGSWGTTLALAYATTYPERVGALILRGVCLFRRQEVDWLFGGNGGAASLNAEGWKEFEAAVGMDGCNDDSMDESNDKRAVLHRYYDCLLDSDPILRIHATRAWMKWEMSIFGYNNSESKGSNEAENQKQPEDSGPLLVWDGAFGGFSAFLRGWSFQNTDGPIDVGQTDRHAANKAQSLRRFSFGSEAVPPEPIKEDDNALLGTPRPIDTKTGTLINASLPPNVTAEKAAKFIPAQAILTCYYSTNDQYVMAGYTDLLSKDTIDRIRHIPCIAIQGGQDKICPPDTALDLLNAWPEMELRIALQSGHSMYDAMITSEIAKATDRLAGIEY